MRTNLFRILVVFTPLIATLVLIYGVLGTSFTMLVPGEFDELGNWHETLTFSRVGLAGGYYTFDELPAPARFSHFDTHGLFFTGFTGVIARVFGWNPQSMFLLNRLMVTGALAAFVWTIRPTVRQSLLLMALLLTFWPGLLFMPSNWQEPTHYAIAIVAACFFIRLLKPEGKMSRTGMIGGVLFLFIAALIRVPWVFVLSIFILLLPDGRIGYRLGLKLLLIAVLGAIALFSYVYFAAPYSLNLTFSALPEAFRQSIGAGLQLFAQKFLYNLNQWNQGHPLEISQRYVFIALLLVILFAGMRAGRRLRLRQPEVMFHLLNLMLVLAFILFIYDLFLWRDYRLFSIHLLLSLLVLVGIGRLERLLWGVVVFQLLLAPAFLEEYRRLRELQGVQPEKIQTFADAITPHLTYDAAAKNSWCNTVLISGFGQELLALPPGIGFSAILNPVFLRYPLKSGYLLLREDIYAEMESEVNAEPLVDTSLGTLYRNLDAVC